MKKILLISDTHGFIDDQILKFVKQADEVWHAGDIGSIEVMDIIKKMKPVRAVYGNIDNTIIRSEYPLDAIFKIENTNVWITHIGGYPNRYDIRIREKLTQNPPNLFISGHSHILKVIYDKKLNLLHMNPGAVGKHGIHQVRTMLRFEIDDENIKNLEIIELENR
ncbi:metallophosphoesterase [Lutibacter sp.]|uniref:metallophosphoesterase family protein n=1 Tax=Lutibacter sp. TaxID=1925666 RepID=UPI0027349E3C|nr:metallophosphoesterase family protein [Lutibacter sp.]MDP3314412.1 metallophosphoesterase family protein [Lutibacter sp.]